MILESQSKHDHRGGGVSGTMSFPSPLTGLTPVPAARKIHAPSAVNRWDSHHWGHLPRRGYERAEYRFRAG
jgi:hypothetical protein